MGSDFAAILKQRRSTLPAITHVDYSARVQTVSIADNPRFHSLLSAFERRTGCPVLVNTSFNVRGEPPVCTVEDAYRCFMKTEMDYLILGNCLLDKTQIGQDALKSPFLDTEPEKLDCSVPALRRFAFTIASVLAALGGFMLWRHRTAGWPLLSVALVLVATALLAPAALRFVYRPWMTLARVLGTITSSILLTVVFFLFVTPLGLVQRLFGKRPLDLRFKSAEPSYWQTRSGNPAAADYEKQF